MGSSRNIVIIGPAHPLRGGLSTFNERMAREFLKNSDKVTLYTFSLQYPSFLFPGTTQYSSEPAPIDLDIRVMINAVDPLNWVRVGRKLKKEKPDLIIVRYWLPFMGPALGSILRIARSNRHTKVICIADNILPHEKRPGDKLFTAYFVGAVDGFVTMSDKVMQDLRMFEMTKPAITLHHPLYDNFGERISQKEARAFLHLPDEKKILLFFGFIRKYKGLDLLISAMDDERIKDMGIVLLVAGEFYQNSEPYLEQIKALGLEDRILLHTHFITDSQVKYYCCAADAIVQPYRSATQSGVTPLAYHFEVPMIVTNVGGLPNMVEDGKSGLVAEPEPASIADHIIEYFCLGKEHFKEHVRTHKQKLSWKSFVLAIVKMYHDLQK